MMVLDDLNTEQYQAVTASPGAVLVLAGPGSGKTRVLTRRIAYLIQTLGVYPYHILAVTFTNKAAREMQSRLEKMLEGQSHGLWLGTFHGACARILRRESQYMPFDSNYVIMDADDQISLVRSAIKELNLDEKNYRPTAMQNAISQAKNNLVLPDDYPTQTYRDEIIARIYKQYNEILKTNNAVDFDDLLLWTVKLFEDNPQVREQYGRRFAHVLVDEFQDTNMVQYQLLRHLSSFHGNLFVVGDEDQSIYRWRGADYRNVLRFEEDYPQFQKILLEKNYRSTQTVLDVARAVIDRNPNRTPKRLSSARGERGDHVILHQAEDDLAEAVFVVETIRQLVAGRKVQYSDFAVMYRTNAQSRLLEEAFLKAGLPYRLVGAQRFYGRREIKDLIAFLRLTFNPSDEISLNRVINVPPRGVGNKTLASLQVCARHANLNPGEVLLDLGRHGMDSEYVNAFSGRSVAPLIEFGTILNGWCDVKDEISLPSLFDRIIEEVDYQSYIEDDPKDREESIQRWGNVQELRRLTFEFQESGLSGFLENMALVSDQDTLPENPDAPTLLTLHAAKGLEFSQVFITGLDDGLLPHSRSFGEPEEMAEERRLFYVGLTRAKNRLYLVRSERRGTYGTYEATIPSRFLSDIPEKLLQESGYQTVKVRSYSQKDTYPRWESDSSAKKRSNSQSSTSDPDKKYRVGMRVLHASWGKGIVMDSRIRDGEETVDIAFETVGFKRVLASLVKLDIIQQ